MNLIDQLLMGWLVGCGWVGVCVCVFSHKPFFYPVLFHLQLTL